MQNLTTISVLPAIPTVESDSLVRVFGHRNPDSDTICSALVVADWLNYRGQLARSYRLGEITPETQYILQAAGVTQPELLTEDLTDKTVWLVDFTDVEQGPPTLTDSNVIGIIDHHRLGTIITRNPPDVWIRAVGCCGTVILHILSKESPMPLTAAQAILLMGAILSDTVALSGPTTTAEDRKAVAMLREIASVDYDKFVAGLLTAKTDLTGQSAFVLLHRDAKNYQIHGVSLLLSQIEVHDMGDITPHLADLQQEIDHSCQHSDLDMVVLMVTDITHHNSMLYFSDNSLTGARQVFLPGMTSRKKEILPWLTQRFVSTKR
ncbi:manganese-dependent inorganic pyrophosphatase [Klebsiella variicola]|uniref:manganese-dependent inorganic pyrophosphatase n=1 Tax=Klebsiella variicola TaxID=244366 RepID=UPI0023F9EF00|nr:manganese-dependent inorganic pyrophosphatase [Klebsiella variicola]MDF7652980.1 manganese-dependent inorganic pyrophosphatase [Klebsiella variicola]